MKFNNHREDKNHLSSFRIAMRMHTALALLVFLAFNMLAVSAFAQTDKLNIKMNNTTLEQIFDLIRKQTGYSILLKSSEVNLKEKVSVNASNQSIEVVLKPLLKNQNLSYEIKDKRIFIFHEKSIAQPVNPKKVKVSGVILDEKDLPFIGVNILARGLSIGTATDKDGKFSLEVPLNTVLQISYTGYRMQLIPVKDDQPLHINMQEDMQDLEGVVVVGYGTMKKKDMMGATSSLSGKDLAVNSNISVGGALQGKMSGMSIISNSGMPGAATSINIRGVGTFGTGDNKPLIVIDGIPVDGGFETLSPADIESVNVMKDASSAAIYGSRAANGVILVSTKKGSSGAAKISLNANYGVQKPSNMIDILSAQQFVSAIQEMTANKKAIDGGNPISNYDGLDPASFGQGTPWSDYIYKNAPTFSLNGSVNGGNEKSLYYISGEYLDQKGIGLNTGFKKGSIRANVEGKASKRLTIGNNINLSYREIRGSQDTRLSDVIFNAPVIPAYDADGSYGEPGKLTSSKNAIAEVAWNTPGNTSYRILDNMFAEYKITDWLKFRFNGGVDVTFDNYKLFSPLFNDGGQTNNQNSLVDDRKKDFMWVTDYLLYFDKQFKDHTFSAMAGYSQQLFSKDNLYGLAKDFVSEVDNMQVIDGGTNSKELALKGGKSQLALASYFGRFNYDYKGRYLFGFNLRADGSSRFKGDNQWGVFPSFSGAWRISQEDFFKVEAIRSMKLRASWGQLGNQSIGSWYPTIASVNKQNVILGNGGNNQSLYSGYSQTMLDNKNLRWETTTVNNFGLDLELLNGKIFFTADYFIKSTDGILRTMVLPPSVGMGAPNFNYAKVKNAGVDMELTYNGKVNDFNFALSGNVSLVKNTIEKLSNGINEEILTAPYGGVTINRVGEAVNTLYGYQTNGVITTKAEADQYKQMGQGNAKIGRLKYIDTNGDGLINGDDRVILGSYIPKVTSGLTLSANWKGFDFNTVFSGVFGRKQHSPMSFQNRMPNRNMSAKWYNNRWTLGADPQGKYPAIIQSESYEEMTDLMVSNTSYLKMRSLTLGYTYPSKYVKTRLYVSGENLLTFTHKDFDGFDPENGNTVGHYTNWGGDYPTAKILLFGLNLTF